MTRALRRLVAVAAALAGVAGIARVARAQKQPPVRQIGRLEHVTSDSLASVASALPLPDGRVLVNDRIARRVLLFDSTLAHATVVADTTGATANAYGRSAGNLIRFRGDSALLIDQSSLSMFVITPGGAIGRVMAIPRAGDAQEMIARTAVDAHGRLVYSYALGVLPGILMLGRGDLILKDGLTRWERKLDTAALVRVDPTTRAVDTLTMVHVPKLDRVLKLDDKSELTSIVTTPDPLPVVDEWAMLHDGTVAVLRGRDFHVDWLSPDGHWSSSPPIPFDWQKLDDARKQALIDSTVTRWQGQYDRVMNGTGGRAATNLAPLIAEKPPVSSLADYEPPITPFLGAVMPDNEDRLWIRTTTMIDGRPVWDVVDRKAGLVDRVQLPDHRTIAGFGPGVIYMAVIASPGNVRLERARLK